MMRIRPIIFFCGDLSNLGDLALVNQNIQVIEHSRPMYARYWSKPPSGAERLLATQGVDLLNSKQIYRFLRASFGSNIVIGGGQLVRDNVSLASLVVQYAGVLMCRLGGGSVEIRGLGVSRLKDLKRRFLWRRLLKASGRMCVRDGASAANVLDLMGSRYNVEQTADMAFVPTRLHAELARPYEGQRQLIIAPCIDTGEDRNFAGDSFDRIISAFREALPNDSIAVICHDPQVDREGAKKLIAQQGAANVEVFDSLQLDSILDAYRAASLVVTNRLHSAIFALLADVALIVVDDGTSKTSELAGEFNVPVLPHSPSDQQCREIIHLAFNYDQEQRKARLDTVKLRAGRNLQGK